MKRKVKSIFTVMLLMIGTVSVLGGNSKAALQANPNTQYKKTDTLVNWVGNTVRGICKRKDKI